MRRTAKIGKNPARRRRRLAVFLLALSLSATAGVIAFQAAIRHDPQGTFTREGIMAILSRETAVFYSDRKTRVGTFYEDEHREYISFDSIPPDLIHALVAAEDKNFFTHGGVDFRALAAAVADNLSSFSIKRGGSSLSQQAAKNLFPRRSKSKMGRLMAKFPELVNTYRLEHHFSKEDILEFYLNQFYVSGNGHGVAIAARYFFNRPLGELKLHELAYIAGCVKGPNQYNPFIARSTEEKEKKLKRARERVHYVLNQMYRNGYIEKQAFLAADSASLGFNRGRFRFSLSTNLVNIQRVLQTEKMQSLFSEYEIDNFMTAGLNVYTTLDKDIQRGAEYAANRNLSELDIILNGFNKINDGKMSIVPALKPGTFLTGEVCSLQVSKGLPTAIQLRFGSPRGWVQSEALDYFLTNWNRHQTGANQVPDKKQKEAFFKNHFRKGDLVFCSVHLDYTKPDSREILLEIAQEPEIQGGLRVVQEGKILANVGGFENTGYDRVEQARRQFGSTFKPIVYAAALELGWSPLDTLDNRRQLFRLGYTFYFPRPYHEPLPFVSMAWAGRHSENIASVSLLYRLFDKMDYAEFWRMCDSLGYSPKAHPSTEHWVLFVRDTLGYLVNDQTAREITYEKIIEEASVDLIFEGEDRDAEILKTLPYGRGFAREAKKYQRKRKSEDSLRHGILEHCYLRYKSVGDRWEKKKPSVRLFRHPVTGSLGLFDSPPPNPWLAHSRPEDAADDSLLVQGVIKLSTLRLIEEKIKSARPLADRYSREHLFLSREFKALIANRYVVAFSRKLGIESRLEPVLSYPLGSNDISLAEAINAYQALKDGAVYQSEMTGSRQIIIKEISLPGGKVIYRDTLVKIPVIRESTRRGITAILHAVVEGGTGQRISKEFRLPSPHPETPFDVIIPAYGKTGTTNDHRNGAFLGYISGPGRRPFRFSPQSGYTIGVYAGFDNNRQMEHKGFIGYGGTVSLSAWIGAAFSVAYAHDFVKKIDFLDLDLQVNTQVHLEGEEKSQIIRVDQATGMPIGENADSTVRAVEFSLGN